MARTIFSLSPTHFDVRDEAEIEKNVALDSVATAFANKVFPVPVCAMQQQQVTKHSQLVAHYTQRPPDPHTCTRTRTRAGAGTKHTLHTWRTKQQHALGW